MRIPFGHAVGEVRVGEVSGPGRFGAVVTAMATPFDTDGALDLGGAAVLARWLGDHGSDALVVTGTTGEGPVLSDVERHDLVRAVAEAVTIPVIAGSSTNDTLHSIKLTRAAAEAGADAILAVTPYYNRPSQAGIEAHFRAVASAVPLPVIVYDIPVRTGRKVTVETMLRLATDVGNIVAVKDASGDVAGAAALIAQAPGGFEHYSGDDALTLAMAAIGSAGVISVASHWAGAEIGEMLKAFFKGDVDRARSANTHLIESWAFETSDAAPNPIPTKAMLRALGLPGGQCRLPLGPAPEGLDAMAEQVLEGLKGNGFFG